MDILMTYWSNVWKQAVLDTERCIRKHTAEELRAFEHSLRRRRRERDTWAPRAKIKSAPRKVAADTAH